MISDTPGRGGGGGGGGGSKKGKLLRTSFMDGPLLISCLPFSHQFQQLVVTAASINNFDVNVIKHYVKLLAH